MKRLALLALSVIVGHLGPGAAPAAAANRVFVSPGGSDANPCTWAKPCRQFTKAMTEVSEGGEVIVLDSGGFGPFTIDKGVSILAPDGVFAGIGVTGNGPGVVVSPPPTAAAVRIRGLTVNDMGSGTTGIWVANAGPTPVFIEKCVVTGFSSGISMGFSRIHVKDTLVRGAANFGLALLDGFTVTIERCAFHENGGAGVAVLGGTATIRDSVSSHNGDGYSVRFGGEMDIEGSLSTDNSGAGIAVLGGSILQALVRVSNSTVTGNDVGLLQDPTHGAAFLLSRGNNTVEGNTTDTLGTIGSYAPR